MSLESLSFAGKQILRNRDLCSRAHHAVDGCAYDRLAVLGGGAEVGKLVAAAQQIFEVSRIVSKVGLGLLKISFETGDGFG